MRSEFQSGRMKKRTKPKRKERKQTVYCTQHFIIDYLFKNNNFFRNTQNEENEEQANNSAFFGSSWISGDTSLCSMFTSFNKIKKFSNFTFTFSDTKKVWNICIEHKLCSIGVDLTAKFKLVIYNMFSEYMWQPGYWICLLCNSIVQSVTKPKKYPSSHHFLCRFTRSFLCILKKTNTNWFSYVIIKCSTNDKTGDRVGKFGQFSVTIPPNSSRIWIIFCIVQI